MIQLFDRDVWRTVAAVLVLVAGAVAQEDPYLEDLRSAERYAENGRRIRARSIFDEILVDAEEFGVGGDGPGAVVVRAARLGLLKIDFSTGAYGDVERALAKLPPTVRSDTEVRALDAELAQRTGDDARAITILRELVASGADPLRFRYVLGRALRENGDEEGAAAEFAAVIAQSRRTSERDPMALTWIARAHIAQNTRADFERASALLVDAIRQDGTLVDARIELGWLRYLAYGEAAGFESGESLLQDVLRDVGEHEDALLRLYEIRKSNSLLDGGKTAELLQRALDLNPKSVDAMRLRATQWIDDRRFDDAAELLDQALEVDPRDKFALAQRAAVAHVRGDAEAEADLRARAFAVDPKFAGVDTALGDRLAALYRFADAIAPYERALERRPGDVEAMQGLARACVYTGDGARARALLQKIEAERAGLIDPWRRNVLAIEALLAEEYEVVEREGFVFRLHRDDRAVLEEYLVPYHVEARAKLGAKYGFFPEDPITVEVLHTWDDFSVRTIGFRGFTALGACFGKLITLVAPVDVDLRKNDFMWTATVWHEFTHVLTLALSKNRVPRWLTEGLSVHEEGAKNPAWERGMERDLLDAYHNGQIPPVRLLNRLFRGPRILFGYYQGGLIVDLLAREHGFGKVIEMLRLYGQDLSQEQIFERAFGMDTRTFDAQFRVEVEARIAKLKIVPRWDERSVQRFLDRVARQPKDLSAQINLAWAMLQRGINVDAGEAVRAAFAIDPDSAEAHLVHAELLRRRDRIPEAIAAYERGLGGKAENFMSRLRYGQILASQGDVDGAARQFLAAKRCWPRCTDQELAPSMMLARLYNKAGRRSEAMMELKAFCRRTARAFQPRLTLASWEHEAKNFAEEAALLRQAVEIDPFMRSLHVRLADALLAIDDKSGAIRELRMALAIDPSVDREFVGAEEKPDPDSPEWRRGQAELALRAARLLRSIGDLDAARQSLQRAMTEAPGSDVEQAARELEETWK